GFARILFDIAHEKGFKALVTSQGNVAINLAKEYRPTALTLDIRLPDIDGWRVLDSLKNDMDTRHIPIYIISATEDRMRGLSQGAIGFLHKPLQTSDPLEQLVTSIKSFVERPQRNLLLVEQSEVVRNSIIPLIGNGDVNIVTAQSGGEAMKSLMDRHFDCVVIGCDLPDTNFVELITKICA